MKLPHWKTDERFGEILTGSAYALTARAGATLCGLALNVAVARWYGADMLGTVAVLHSFLLLSTTLTLLGTGTSMLRLLPEHEAKFSTASALGVYRRALGLVVATGLVLGLVLWLLAEPIAAVVFGKPYLSPWFALAAGFVVFDSLVSLSTATVRGLRRIGWYAVLLVAPPVVELVLLLAGRAWTAAREVPVYALLGSLLVVGLGGLVVVALVFRGRLKPGGLVVPISVSGLLSVSLPMLATAGLNLAMGQTAVVLLGMLRTEEEVGYFSVAVRLASVTIFMLLAINSMAGPKFSELFHSGRLDELFDVARRSARLVFWVTAPVLGVLVVGGRWILAGFFGPEFEAAYPALLMLVVGQFVNASTGSTGMFMNMTGLQKQFRNLVLVVFSVHLAGNLLLIPAWGITGAALTSMVTTSALNLATLQYIRRRYGQTVGYFPSFGRSVPVR